MVLGTVPGGASPALLSTHPILSRVSDSLLHPLLSNLLCLLAVSRSGALGPTLTCAFPQYLLRGCLTLSNQEMTGRKAECRSSVDQEQLTELTGSCQSLLEATASCSYLFPTATGTLQFLKEFPGIFPAFQKMQNWKWLHVLAAAQHKTSCVMQKQQAP